jgi:NADPH-dependent 7-cyano-7-deazaguanine reductase QueF
MFQCSGVETVVLNPLFVKKQESLWHHELNHCKYWPKIQHVYSKVLNNKDLYNRLHDECPWEIMADLMMIRNGVKLQTSIDEQKKRIKFQIYRQHKSKKERRQIVSWGKGYNRRRNKLVKAYHYQTKHMTEEQMVNYVTQDFKKLTWPNRAKVIKKHGMKSDQYYKSAYGFIERNTKMIKAHKEHKKIYNK